MIICLKLKCTGIFIKEYLPQICYNHGVFCPIFFIDQGMYFNTNLEIKNMISSILFQSLFSTHTAVKTFLTWKFEGFLNKFVKNTLCQLFELIK